MPLAEDPHRNELRAAGWQSRGYLPHFDGRELPQFMTLHLGDSVPSAVIEKWRLELEAINSRHSDLLLRSRIEKYVDQGYGKAFFRDPRLAAMVQEALLGDDGRKYRLFAWVVMPNHVHFLLTRFPHFTLAEIMQSFKSLTAHKANRMLGRSGQLWMPDYFDRYIRNERHFEKTVKYIERNPVQARICATAKEYPFSSAWFREHGSAGTPSSGSAGALARS
jgi:REP element-mobilizing transposase RayT